MNHNIQRWFSLLLGGTLLTGCGAGASRWQSRVETPRDVGPITERRDHHVAGDRDRGGRRRRGPAARMRTPQRLCLDYHGAPGRTVGPRLAGRIQRSSACGAAFSFSEGSAVCGCPVCEKTRAYRSPRVYVTHGLFAVQPAGAAPARRQGAHSVPVTPCLDPSHGPRSGPALGKPAGHPRLDGAANRHVAENFHATLLAIWEALHMPISVFTVPPLREPPS